MTHDPHTVYLGLFAASFAGCWILQFVIFAWSRRAGLLDRGDARRPHDGAISRLGGLALWPVLSCGMALAVVMWPSLWRPESMGVLLGAFLLTVAGLWDDLRGLHATIKLLVQLAAAGVLVAWGYRIDAISMPFTGQVLALGVWSTPVTVIAVVLLLNAVNLLEGLNGSPGAYAAIIAVFLLFLEFTRGVLIGGGELVLLLGFTLGYLAFNVGRIKTFLGDAGSMVLGLIIASELLRANTELPRLTVLAMPVVLFGIPIIQMLKFQTSRALFDAVAHDAKGTVSSGGASWTRHREIVVLHAFAPLIGRRTSSEQSQTADTQSLRPVDVAVLVVLVCLPAVPVAMVSRSATPLWYESHDVASTVPGLLEAGRAHRAVRVSAMAVDHAPDAVGPRYWYARSLMELGDAEAGLDQYGILFALDQFTAPQRSYFFPPARIAVGNHDELEGDTYNALKNYALAGAFGNEPNAPQPSIGTVFADFRAYDSAMDWGWRIPEEQRLPADDLKVLARVLAFRNDWAGLLRVANELKATDNGTADGDYWMGRALFARGQRAPAVQAFDAATRAGHPDAPFYQAMADPDLAVDDQAALLLRTSEGSIYRPLALIRALEIADSTRTAGSEAAMFEDRAREAILREPAIPMPYPHDGRGPRLLGLTVEGTALRDNEPFTAIYHWQTTKKSDAERAHVTMDPAGRIVATFEGRALDARPVANLVPFGAFEDIPTGAGLPPGWPACYVIAPPSEDASPASVVVKGSSQWLQVSSGNSEQPSMVSSYWMPIDPGKEYVLAVRARSEDARLVAGWNWHDHDGAQVAMANVYNQEKLDTPRWRAYRQMAPASAAYVRATIGIFNDEGQASFDAVMILPADPPALNGP